MLAVLRLASQLDMARYFERHGTRPAQSQGRCRACPKVYLPPPKSRSLDSPAWPHPHAISSPWAQFAVSHNFARHRRFRRPLRVCAGWLLNLTAPLPLNVKTLKIGGRVQHTQHGLGTILAIRGDRLSPRLEIQFARGKPVVLPAKFVELSAY